MPSNNPAPTRLNPKRGTTILKYDLYCALGRQALAVALKTLEQGHLGILLPEFICRDVPETCRRMGFVIRWYAVDRQLRPVGLSRQPACRAILAVHYFGFPQDLRPFQAYCRRVGAYLIEDAAHAYLSKTPQGKPLGTVGDFGIFSFRKTLPTSDGAALKTCKTRRNATCRLAKSIGGRPASRKLENLWKNVMRKCPKVGLTFRFLLRPIWVRWEKIRITPEFQPPFSGFSKVMQAVNPREEIRRRRSAWKSFQALGLQSGIRPLFANLPAETCPYGYPFFSKNPSPAIHRAAKAKGFSMIRWPDLPHEVKRSAPKFYHEVYLINFLKSCPN